MEQTAPKEDSTPPEEANLDQEFNLSEVIEVTANTVGHGKRRSLCSAFSFIWCFGLNVKCLNFSDSGVSEGLVLTSDSESEIFCDSVDSVEQLSNIKVKLTESLAANSGSNTQQLLFCAQS